MVDYTLLQKIFTTFDICFTKTVDDQEDSIAVILYLLSSMYLCLKVERSCFAYSFLDFAELLFELSSFKILMTTLQIDQNDFFFDKDIYPLMERNILIYGLMFRIDFSSAANAIYQILCTFAETYQVDCKIRSFQKFQKDALFSSFVYLQGKFKQRRHL